jgi:hypothetical protein
METLKKLAELADKLDSMGFSEEANQVDKMISRAGFLDSLTEVRQLTPQEQAAALQKQQEEQANPGLFQKMKNWISGKGKLPACNCPNPTECGCSSAEARFMSGGAAQAKQYVEGCQNETCPLRNSLLGK